MIVYRGARMERGSPIVLRCELTAGRFPVKSTALRRGYSFGWGDDPGSYALATAILEDAIGKYVDHDTAEEFRQAFVVGWGRDGWEMAQDEIVDWARDFSKAQAQLEENRRKHREDCERCKDEEVPGSKCSDGCGHCGRCS